LKQLLMRQYQADAEFMIGDPTEMERYKAPKTSYVGTLSDGKTAGYWLMVPSVYPVPGTISALLVCGLLIENHRGSMQLAKPGALSLFQ